MSICHPHVHLSKNSGRIAALAVITFSFTTVIANFFEFETLVSKIRILHTEFLFLINGIQSKTEEYKRTKLPVLPWFLKYFSSFQTFCIINKNLIYFFSQTKFSDTPQPGFVPLDSSNYSYYIAVPTSLRVDPNYCKVKILFIINLIINITVTHVFLLHIPVFSFCNINNIFFYLYL